MDRNAVMQLLVIQTGGTIDKSYPQQKGAYAFEIGESAAKSILERHRIPLKVRYETVCQKDSQYISDEDRLNLLTICNDCSEKHIIITHGTDTLLKTAAFLGHQNLPKRIILTGAFLPEKFRDSDATFNVGTALGAIQCMTENGIFVVLNGLVLPWKQAMREPDTGQFVRK
ncbi:L-asparaginase 1-like [Diadema setosum]|uniref:L-asparaginase 1-like n=1 Tax=Diadema setosum TaxID=31175 RepID=UPI003B3B78A8